MSIRVESKSPAAAAVDLLAVPLASTSAQARLPARIAALDAAAHGRISAAIAAGDFTGGNGQTLLVHPGDGVAAARILLIGLGDDAKLDADGLRAAAGTAARAGRKARGRKVGIVVPAGRRARGAEGAQALAEGVVLGLYRFDRYRGPDEEEPRGDVDAVLLVDKTGDARAARAGVKTGVILAESQNLTRDLSNEPPNHLPPAALARAAQKVAREVGLRARVLGPKELEKLGMGAMLAVGQGSVNPPRLIVLEHGAPAKRARKGARTRKTVCLVGKGVCFDSGGLSLKPSANMVKMKHDMSGGATVIGALRAVALLNLPLHVVGIVGAVENMPSGTAYRVDDILKSASGKTIEVTNTDAEGRLVLADCLHYAQTGYDPAVVVDLATLTGAVIVALGPWAAAVVSNDEKLSKSIVAAGETTGERFWPLPLWDVHRQHMKSRIADVRQTGGRDAGTVTAAAFLSHFVGEVPWAHLDIAGVADTERGTPTHVAGATGFGVRTLLGWLRAGKGF